MDIFRQIVEGAPDAVLAVDREGRIVLWNASAERMFGWSAEEACAGTLDLIVPERQRDAHWTGFRGAVASGTTKYATDLLAVPAMRKDGTRISVEMTVSFLRDDDRAVSGIAAVVRDVSERRAQERTTRERIAELEQGLREGGNSPA